MSAELDKLLANLPVSAGYRDCLRDMPDGSTEEAAFDLRSILCHSNLEMDLLVREIQLHTTTKKWIGPIKYGKFVHIYVRNDESLIFFVIFEYIYIEQRSLNKQHLSAAAQ